MSDPLVHSERLMTENRRQARHIVDAVVAVHGNEVWLGEGYAADELLVNSIQAALDVIRVECDELRNLLKIASQQLAELRQPKTRTITSTGKVAS